MSRILVTTNHIVQLVNKQETSEKDLYTREEVDRISTGLTITTVLALSTSFFV